MPDYKTEFQSKLIGTLREKETKHKNGTILKTGLDKETINSHIAKHNTFYLWAFDNEYTVRQIRIKRVRVERKAKRAHSTERQLKVEYAISFGLYDPSIKPFHGSRSRVTTIVGMINGIKSAQLQAGDQDPRIFHRWVC